MTKWQTIKLATVDYQNFKSQLKEQRDLACHNADILRIEQIDLRLSLGLNVQFINKVSPWVLAAISALCAVITVLLL